MQSVCCKEFGFHHVLEHILDKYLWINEKDEYTDIVKNVIRNKNLLQPSKTASINRYCSQNNFNLLFVGGKNRKDVVVRNALTINANNFFNANNLPQIEHARKFPQVVCIKGEVYVFGGIDNNLDQVIYIEKFSPGTNT